MPSATLPGCCCIIVELQGGRSAPSITMFFSHGSRISARRCLGYLLSQLSPPTLPRHWPHFTEGSPHRIAHTGGSRVISLNLRAWVTPTICGHLAAVCITQWIVITVALWWVPPPTVGAIAGGEWWDSTAGFRQSRGVLSAAVQTKTSRSVDLV